MGQQGEDYEAITKKAKDCGASKVYIEDLCEEFVTDFVFEAVKANAQYEGRYLLGTRRVVVSLPCASPLAWRRVDLVSWRPVHVAYRRIDATWVVVLLLFLPLSNRLCLPRVARRCVSQTRK